MTAISKAIADFANARKPGEMTLDVGCGLRPYEGLFSRGKYIGIDVPQSGRTDEGKMPDIEFDGTYIPFEDNKFDVILCTEVLEHAIDPEKLMSEMWRVMKPEGRLILTVPFMWGLHELPYDFRRYTTEGIRSAVERAGFHIVTLQKLNPGIEAMQMLISSETNYFLKHVIDEKQKNSYKFRCLYFLQRKLLRLILSIWSGSFKFDRIYIDNLIIAEKR